MLTVADLLDKLAACDHYIVVYDENVVGLDSEDSGDALWDSDAEYKVPSYVARLEVLSFDLEGDVFRIWVNGAGEAHMYL